MSADPRDEHWADLAETAPGEVIAEINRMRERCRQAMVIVNTELPQGVVKVDWPMVEAEIRGLGGLVLEHLLPQGTPERLLYELHVMREFLEFANRAVAEGNRLAEERAAVAARNALLQGVGPVPGGMPGMPGMPGVAGLQGLTGLGGSTGRPVRERPSHFGGRPGG